jgi:hypothetical protein
MQSLNKQSQCRSERFGEKEGKRRLETFGDLSKGCTTMNSTDAICNRGDSPGQHSTGNEEARIAPLEERRCFVRLLKKMKLKGMDQSNDSSTRPIE